MKKLICTSLLLMSFTTFAGMGFIVNEVQPDSFYSKIKLLKGDTIKKINGKEIDGLNQLMSYMGSPGNIKTVTVLRKGKVKFINL